MAKVAAEINRPQPSPPSDGSACENSSGVFPAGAYSEGSVVGRHGRSDIVEQRILLTNSKQDCSVVVY